MSFSCINIKQGVIEIDVFVISNWMLCILFVEVVAKDFWCDQICSSCCSVFRKNPSNCHLLWFLLGLDLIFMAGNQHLLWHECSFFWYLQCWCGQRRKWYMFPVLPSFFLLVLKCSNSFPGAHVQISFVAGSFAKVLILGYGSTCDLMDRWVWKTQFYLGVFWRMMYPQCNE